MTRGDRLWADSAYAEALAEYRLALQARPEDPAVLRRVGHAFARTGQARGAVETYTRLLQVAPDDADQVVYDYVSLARRALARGDRHGMSVALEAAAAVRPGLNYPELSLPLAHYELERGDRARAIAFFERALASASADSAPALMFEIGRLQQDRGDCATAIGYFEAYVRQAPQGTHAADARWRTGSCLLDLARGARAEGNLDQAFRHLSAVIRLGQPRNLLDQVWLERGEILLEVGQVEEARTAFLQVLIQSLDRSTPHAERARRRLEELATDPGPGTIYP